MTRIHDRAVASAVACSCLALAVISCGGGGSGGTGGPEQLASSYPGAKIIFVTHTLDDGNLIGWMPQCSGRSTGLEAADCICQQHATIWGNLSGTYRAWLSDSTQSASTRLSHSTVPYVNRRGEFIAADWTGLAGVQCTDLMNYDESGEVMSTQFNKVWTGSDSSGNAPSPTRTCGDWTSASIGQSGWIGSATVDSYWPNFAGCWSEWVEGNGWTECDLWARLYCIEQ